MEELNEDEEDGTEAVGDGEEGGECCGGSETGVQVKRHSSEEEEEEKEEHILSGRMLTMAGLFDINTEQEEVRLCAPFMPRLYAGVYIYIYKYIRRLGDLRYVKPVGFGL